MAHSEDWFERRIAVEQLEHDFADLPDKEQAWNDLLALTKDKDSNVRYSAVFAFGSAFPHIKEKEQATKKLLELTKDEHYYMRGNAALSLGSALSHITDKEQATKKLLELTKDNSINVRKRVASALGEAFPYVTDKKLATKKLLKLTKDKSNNVRSDSVSALGYAFSHVVDKKQATKALLELTKDEDNWVRMRAASSLGSAFPYVTDKEQAMKYLLVLIKDEIDNVRWRAVSSLGSAFPHVTDKEQVWKVLLALTKDEVKNVRSYAYHSLGKISIIKATEADGEEDFRKELEHSLEYFEKSAKETKYSPAKFCLPFYRSFHALTFRKDESEAEVKKSIEQAKNAVGGSESKEKLLEAVENLSNALTEAQKAKGFDEIKGDLTAYSRYCNRATDLLGETEVDAPGATGLIRKGLPIINQNIKDILAEIKKKTDDFCKETKDTPNEDIGTEIRKIGKELSNIRDPIALEKSVDNLQMQLSEVCNRMPQQNKGEACKLLETAKKEQFVEDKLNLLNIVLGKVSLEPEPLTHIILNNLANLLTITGFVWAISYAILEYIGHINALWESISIFGISFIIVLGFYSIKR